MFRSMLAGSALTQLVLVRFREFFREPESLFWVLVFPVLMAAALGVAFRNAPAPILKVAAATPALARALRQDPTLDVSLLSVTAARSALRIGKVALVAEPAPRGGVSYRYDNTNSESRTARMLADRAIQRAGGRRDPVAALDVLSLDPGSRYIDFLVPGLLGMNLMTSAIWGAGYTTVDARRRKLIKRLVATPMRRSTYLLSFVIYRLLLMPIEAGGILAFGILIFHVPFVGSICTLALVCLMTTLASTALGLLIAARVQTVEAATGLMNFILLPMWIASGVFFSPQRFPEALQPFIKALPMTAAIDALRATLLQGSGVMLILPQLASLAAWMLGCFALALVLFRWR